MVEMAVVPVQQFSRRFAAVCCVCDRPVSARERDECRSLADGTLEGEMYCRSCFESQVVLCRECSCRRTAHPSGICEECLGQGYALAG
jgi:hypothetical protein